MNYYIPGARPNHELGSVHHLRHEPDSFIPKTLEEATKFVLGKSPPTVDVYFGRPDIQFDVAREIAGIIFRPGEPINTSYDRWLSGDSPTSQSAAESEATILGDSRLPQAIGLAATRTLEEQREVIANTRYVPSSTPIEPQVARNGRPVETLTTGVL